MNTSLEIKVAKSRLSLFLTECNIGLGYKLTPLSEASPFALCFAIFIHHLLKNDEIISTHAESWSYELRGNLKLHFDNRVTQVQDLKYDKSFLQLLCFTLSALHIIGTLNDDPLKEMIEPLISIDVHSDLKHIKALDGSPGSGNLAMFMAILLLHAKLYLNLDTDLKIKDWVELHLESINSNGFWGAQQTMSYLQFQNGYHQYEILEYLGLADSSAKLVSSNVKKMVDKIGHFSPYVGGGGCFDFDAIFLLSLNEQVSSNNKDILLTSVRTILCEQNLDGGFCESRYIRPRSFKNSLKSIEHVFSSNRFTLKERLRQALTLQRNKYNRINTHWSKYSREWGESDLWDSWFRMLLIARVDVSIDPSKFNDWGFIEYPGIGYHHYFKNRNI